MTRTTAMREPQTTSAATMTAVREKFADSAREPSALQSLRLLWVERHTLGKVVVAGAVIGFVMAFLLPVKYQSSVQLMPPDSQPGLSLPLLAAMSQRSGNGLGMVAGDALGIKSSGSLFIGVLRSRTVEDRLVDKFSLKKVYGVRLAEQARNVLQSNTDISEDRKSGIIAISVRDTNAKRATSLAQANVEELNHLVVELSTSAAHRERVFLEERLVTIKESLDQASREFSKFASENAALDIKEQGRAVVQSAALLQGQWIAAESELRGLEAIYTPNNVRVRALQARISELRQQVQKMNGSENKIAGGVDQGGPDYPSLRTLPLLGVTYADLYRRTRIEETVYETLTQQYELAKVEEAKETPSVKVLDSASVPERKVFPPRLVVIVLSMGVTFLAGIAAIIAKDRWRRLPTVDPAKMFVLEVLHSVRASASRALPNASWQSGIARVWKKVFRGASTEKRSGIANR